MSDKPEKLNIRSDEGPVMLHMDSIESIGIENPLDVESHTINWTQELGGVERIATQPPM